MNAKSSHQTVAIYLLICFKMETVSFVVAYNKVMQVLSAFLVWFVLMLLGATHEM